MSMNTHKKLLTGIAYFVAAVLIFGILIYLAQITSMSKFLTSIENKTFDLRQNILFKYKKHNEDIVIIAVDDPSYEYIADQYGTWPVPRSFWANMIDSIEKSNPKLIAFDLLFVKKLATESASDAKLVESVVNNSNVLLSIVFDDHPPEVRKPEDLPDALKNKVVNDKLIKTNPSLTFSNCKGIMSELLYGTPEIGMVNTFRDDDGVIRKFPPMIIYKGDYYKHLALLSALEYLGIDKNAFEMKNNAIILDKNHSIPLNKDGEALLNWYGGEKTFKYYSLYKVDEAIRNNDRKFLDESFKGKLVYVGTTALALSDVKTSPISRMHPGVEIHTTFVNNVLDNNFIRRVDIKVDLIVSFVLCILIGIGVLRSKSVFFTVIQIFLVFFGYAVLAIYLMHSFNLWIGVVLPFSFATIMFISCYIVKYLLTYRDYEHTYRLAVTDGLTSMFNHRYFQEQMLSLTNTYERYETPFSLILIDIDFFKKFNDAHGHQSGDAVLRQVATTIKKSIRTTDIACRYGGEEMAVILPNTQKEEAVVVATKIWSAIEQGQFELATGAKTNVTVSLGVASMPKDGKSPTRLIEYADRCLYKAKAQGRNQVVQEA